MAEHHTHQASAQPVKALLVSLGITQTQVAERSGVHVTNVCNALNGRKPPMLQLVEALEELTGRPVDELFEPERFAKCWWRLRELKTGSRRPGGEGQ